MIKGIDVVLYEKTKVGAKRVRAKVKASTPHAYYSNLKHNTLMKALGK